MAVIHALMSVTADQGDGIASMAVGASSLVFAARGQLYLVAVSSRDEAAAALQAQLEVLYQSIVMAVTAGVCVCVCFVGQSQGRGCHRGGGGGGGVSELPCIRRATNGNKGGHSPVFPCV
jgi:hypothetical protein